jgi:dolichyl-phosphate-mannose--protein O-mannosyl transferase
VHFLPYLELGLLDYAFEVAIWGVSLIVMLVIVYIATFSLHLILLPLAGPGLGYLPQSMKAQLVSNNCGAGLWGVRIAGMSLTDRVVALTRDMHHGNMGITQFHDSMSFPSQWPLMTGISTYFWGRDGCEIRCIGNLFSYVFAFAGVVGTLLAVKRPQFWDGVVLSLGWSCCYFPFYLIPRVMYSYHYCIPLLIGCMAFGAAIDTYVPVKWRGVVAVAAIACTVFGFYLWSPYTYGTVGHDKDVVIWSKVWTEGTAEHQSRRASHWAAEKNQNK